MRRACHAEWRSRGFENFDRADHPHRVPQVDSRVWIQSQKSVAHRLRIESLQLVAQDWVGRYARQVEPIAQGVDIEHRPPLDDGKPPARRDVFDGLARTLDILRRVEVARRIDEIDHVIADLLAPLGAWFIGRDVEALVDLSRVRHDYLAVESPRQLKRQL
jgi:hypothetical protein